MDVWQTWRHRVHWLGISLSFERDGDTTWKWTGSLSPEQQTMQLWGQEEFFLSAAWLCSIMRFCRQPGDAITATHTRGAKSWCCLGLLPLSQEGITLKLCLLGARWRPGLEVRLLTNSPLLLGHDTPSRAEAWPYGGFPFWQCWRNDWILARLKKAMATLIKDHGHNSWTWVASGPRSMLSCCISCDKPVFSYFRFWIGLPVGVVLDKKTIKKI